jgi:hypothetical protein
MDRSLVSDPPRSAPAQGIAPITRREHRLQHFG